MASFRTGFKIFGEISLKQGLGRIRSFSEDRKPGQWLPEDQWAVRQPGSTCPEQCCEKPKKRAKPSKSWLSLCKDPEKPLECDIRHSNCPPPPVKEDGPWYSLDNLIPKKKQEKPPPLQSCREEIKRKELCPDEEEVCENIVDKTLTIDIKPEHPETCMPKQEPSPAPVATLSCPLPKELNLMLWCGRPSKDTSRIAMACQSDKLPFQEFRPQKVWKAPPFSLPIRSDPPYPSQNCNIGCIPYSEFKQVEVPKPLYTRYKSVELGDSNFLLNMIDVQCPDDETIHTKAIRTFPNPNISKNVEKDKKKNVCPEKPLIAVGSVKPVRLKNAPKFEFRPKPTKLVEKRIPKNPCAKNKPDLPCRPPEDAGECKCGDTLPKSVPKEPPKVITTTLTNEPQIFEANVPLPTSPPKWMYVLCKPGSKETPLVPNKDVHPKEPDWSSETDGLKFYDGNDEQITPKPLKSPKLLNPCPPETKAKAEGDKTEGKKAEGMKTEGIKTQGMKAEGIKTEGMKAEEKKADEKKTCEKKAVEIKVDEKKADEKKVDDKKTDVTKAEEKKAEEKKADEKKADEKKEDEKKSCEKKADEKKEDDKKTDVTKADQTKAEEKKAGENVPVPCPKEEKDEPVPVFRDRRVLMPEKFNIKLRSQEAPVKIEESEETVEKFIESKTSNLKKSTKSITPMKENILYDLQRMCLNVPFDPTKLNAPCRKPPPPECPRPPKFYRSFSTFSPVPIKNLYSDQLFKFQRRTECGDTSGKCQNPVFTPAPRECPEKPKPKDCAEITLPCCPKARFPPSCMVKKPMPPCKKRLAPKPSFSECSKDPPPCPKMTECNCWEKKPGKNRKYSDWAVQRGDFWFEKRNYVFPLPATRRFVHFAAHEHRMMFRRINENRVRQITRQNERNDWWQVSKPVSYKHLDTIRRGEYASKVKCSTLKPTQNAFGEYASGGLMLGLKDPNTDSACEYEHKSVLVKKKRAKKEPLPKETRASEILKCREQNMSKMQDNMSTESKVTAENETNVFDLSEQNEMNPKSFSIGSWINDLFNVPNKRQSSSQEESAKPIQEERLIIDENSQYFKTISALKEEFRKKLRSETSIQVSTGDNPLKFDFCAEDKKTKKRSRSLPFEQSSESHVENVDDFIFVEEEVRADVLNTEKLVPVRQKYVGETLLEPYELKSNLDVNCTSLVKEKKKAKRKNRSNIEGLDEYLTPSLSELSKGLLLNINDSEKCIQLYKNAHLNMQESQHYGQKKNKSYQNSARCYTTNTNLTECFGDSSPKSSIKSYADYQNARVCQPFPNDSPMKKPYEDSSLRSSCHESRKNSFYKQPPRKLFSEFSRDSSTFVKVTQKSPVALPVEPGKYDTKPTSDDLVKYLMKKVKSQRHLQPKKKSFVPATVKVGARNHRIMQSATSSLVMNVIAKKESENLIPFKNGSRISIENGIFKGEILSKPLFQAKDWSTKFKDNNVVKFDIKKATVQHRFNKNSYLSLDELEAKEIPCNKSLVKNAKRPYEDLIGNIVKERSEKLNKRLEVKKMLLKLDAKSTILPNNTKKYKLKKNMMKYPSLNLRNPELKDSQELGRFHHQHELFKSAIQPCTALNLVTSEKFFEAEGVPYEVESSDKTVQLGFDLASDIKANETKEECETEESSLMPMEADAENSTPEPMSINEKSDLLCLDTDKSQTLKDKLQKTKPSFIKDESQSILSPIMECNSNENPKQKDGANVCEPSACTSDIRHGKALDGCSLNRRYSTNIPNECKQKGYPNKTASFITELLKEHEGEMNDCKDKKKDDNAKKSAFEEPAVKTQDQIMKNLLPLK